MRESQVLLELTDFCQHRYVKEMITFHFRLEKINLQFFPLEVLRPSELYPWSSWQLMELKLKTHP